MDALAQLALMTKAKMVFESPGSFLSFPALSPISYGADQLKFGAFTAVESSERLVSERPMPRTPGREPDADTSIYGFPQETMSLRRVRRA